jgi:hypothetical protein
MMSALFEVWEANLITEGFQVIKATNGRKP